MGITKIPLLGSWRRGQGREPLMSLHGCQEGVIKCLTQVHGHSVCPKNILAKVPFPGYIKYALDVKPLGHLHPVWLLPRVQYSDYHLERKLGYRCHQMAIHCAQLCTTMWILSHLQEAVQVILLAGVWVKAHTDVLWAADDGRAGSGKVSAKIPQLGPNDFRLPVDWLGWHLRLRHAL